MEFSPEDAARTERSFLAEVVTAAIDAGVTLVLAYAVQFVPVTADRYELLVQACENQDTGPLELLFRTWENVPVLDRRVPEKHWWKWGHLSLLTSAYKCGNTRALEFLASRARIDDGRPPPRAFNNRDFSISITMPVYTSILNDAFKNLHTEETAILLRNKGIISVMETKFPDHYARIFEWGNEMTSTHWSAWQGLDEKSSVSCCAEFFLDIFSEFPFLCPWYWLILHIFSRPEHWERGVPFVQAARETFELKYWVSHAMDKMNIPLLRWIRENKKAVIDYQIPESVFSVVLERGKTDPGSVGEFAGFLEEIRGTAGIEHKLLYMYFFAEDLEAWKRLWDTDRDNDRVNRLLSKHFQGLSNIQSKYTDRGLPLAEKSPAFTTEIVRLGYDPGSSATRMHCTLNTMVSGDAGSRDERLAVLLAAWTFDLDEFIELVTGPVTDEIRECQFVTETRLKNPVFSELPSFLAHVTDRASDLAPQTVAKYVDYAIVTQDPGFREFLRDLFGVPVDREAGIQFLYKTENIEYEVFKRLFEEISHTPYSKSRKRRKV